MEISIDFVENVSGETPVLVLIPGYAGRGRKRQGPGAGALQS
jgi:hypothetical protein